jgi:hypothetical protein
VLPEVEKAFEVLPGREAVDFLRRGFTEVPKEDVVAIRVEAEGKLTVLLDLDVQAVLLGLLAANFGVS